MHTIPGPLTPLAFITSLVLDVSVRIRNSLYESSLLPRRRLRSPVISIGNITTGGTGKTPLTIFIAGKVLAQEFIPVVLSRGYGRSDPGASRIILPGERIQSPALEIGDEPALIRRHVPEAWFGISKDRFGVGSRIERDESRIVFILDDGFQHRKLHRDLDIVIIDKSQPLESNRMFPRGTLRESLSGLRRCDTIVVNDTPLSGSGADSFPSDIDTLDPQADLYHCEQSIGSLVPLESWIDSATVETESTQIKSAFLVAALGNPQRFQTDVRKLGIRITGSRFHKDHYRLQASDRQACVKAALKTGADAIIITEKDAVKIAKPFGFPVFVAIQETRFAEEEAFNDLLHRSIMKK